MSKTMQGKLFFRKKKKEHFVWNEVSFHFPINYSDIFISSSTSLLLNWKALGKYKEQRGIINEFEKNTAHTYSAISSGKQALCLPHATSHIYVSIHKMISCWESPGIEDDKWSESFCASEVLKIHSFCWRNESTFLTNTKKS